MLLGNIKAEIPDLDLDKVCIGSKSTRKHETESQ